MGACLFGDRNQHAQPSQSHTGLLTGRSLGAADIRRCDRSGVGSGPVDDSREIRHADRQADVSGHPRRRPRRADRGIGHDDHHHRHRLLADGAVPTDRLQPVLGAVATNLPARCAQPGGAGDLCLHLRLQHRWATHRRGAPRRRGVHSQSRGHRVTRAGIRQHRRADLLPAPPHALDPDRHDHGQGAAAHAGAG